MFNFGVSGRPRVAHVRLGIIVLGQLGAYWSLHVLGGVGSSVILGWGSTRLAFSACCSVRVERSRIVGNTAIFQEHTQERVV